MGSRIHKLRAKSVGLLLGVGTLILFVKHLQNPGLSLRLDPGVYRLFIAVYGLLHDKLFQDVTY